MNSKMMKNDPSHSGFKALKAENEDKSEPKQYLKRIALSAITTAGRLSLVELAEKAKDVTHAEKQLDAVRRVRMLNKSTSDQSINELISYGILPILVNCLKHKENQTLQLEAAWALSNITESTSLHTNQVVQANAVPLLIELINSSSAKVCECALWGLANILGDGPALRLYVIRQGIIRPLLSRIKCTDPIWLLRTMAWTLSNLCAVCVEFPILETEIIPEILSALSILLDCMDLEVFNYVLITLKYLVSNGSWIHIIFKSEVIPKVIQLLDNDSWNVKLNALCVLDDLCKSCSPDEHAHILRNHNALNYLSALLGNTIIEMRIGALRVLAYVLFYKQHFDAVLDAVLDAGLLPQIIENLGHDNLEIQQIAAAALRNISRGCSCTQISELTKSKAIPALCNLLTCKDTHVLLLALESIDPMIQKCDRTTAKAINVIYQCDGLRKIEQLKSHKCNEIRKLAAAFWDKSFRARKKKLASIKLK